MENFGAELKAHREKRGIRLEEIASITKIHLHSLELLESGHWDQLPPEPFIRGFISAYAKYVGLNPKDILDRYYEAMGKSAGPALVPPQTMDPRSRSASTPVPTDSGLGAATTTVPPKVWVAASVVGVVIFIGILVYVGKNAGNPPKPSPVAAETPAENPASNPDLLKSAAGLPLETPEKNSERSVATKDGSELPEEATPKKKHEIEIQGKERTWIKVVIDESQPQEFFLNEGQNVTYSADEKIKVVLGNSTGSKVLYNGKPVEGIRFMGTIRSYRFPANARFPQDLATKRTGAESAAKEEESPASDKTNKSLSPGL